MDNKNELFKILIAVVAVIIVGLVIYFSVKKPKTAMLDTNTQTATQELCFYYEKPTNSGLKDVAWLRLEKTGNQVIGELKNLPAEKDSKVGTLTGEVSLENGVNIMNGWWNSMAEGMTVTEELIIKYDEKAAHVGFSEMIDRGDGTYVYKDKTNIPYFSEIPKVSCVILNEKVYVEKYIREHISEIAPNKASMGGTWYVTKISVNPDTNTATVSYEDGHTSETTVFEYTLNKDNSVITTALGDK